MDVTSGVEPLSVQVGAAAGGGGGWLSSRRGSVSGQEGSGSDGWGWCAAERGGGSCGSRAWRVGEFLNHLTCPLAELLLRWR